MAKAYADARENAAEETGVPRAELPEHCPWTLEQMLEKEFWPER